MSRHRLFAIGKILKSEMINHNTIQIVEGINSLYDLSQNFKFIRVLYPDGSEWYRKIPKKNQDLMKIYFDQKEFIKSCQLIN